MEMAGIVCYTGANIIKMAHKIVKEIGSVHVFGFYLLRNKTLFNMYLMFVDVLWNLTLMEYGVCFQPVFLKISR